jgi:hypothetical protein
MASNTQETEFKRARRHKNAGKARKARLKNHGTTPVFPIHTPASDALAPNQAKGAGLSSDDPSQQG